MATTTHTNPVIYDAVETVSRDELATLQLGRLREVVRRRGIDARVDALDNVRDLRSPRRRTSAPTTRSG